MNRKPYLPCQVDVVEFKVERGFADSFLFTQDATNNMLWYMVNENGSYRNESYLDQPFNWADERNPFQQQ